MCKRVAALGAGLLMVAVILGCGGEERKEDPAAEIEAGMNVADGAGGLLRLLAFFDQDQVDWSSPEAAETAKLAAIQSSVGKLPCVKVVQVVQSGSPTLHITFSCRLLPRLEGEAEVSATADFARAPAKLTVTWKLSGLGVRRFHVSGHGRVVHHKDPGQIEAGVNLQSSGVASVVFQADGSMTVDGTGETLCTVVSGLSFAEAGSLRVAVALKGLRYCAASCPQDGDLTLAGRYLQRLHFTPQGASYSLDDARPAPLAAPLACSKDR